MSHTPETPPDGATPSAAIPSAATPMPGTAPGTVTPGTAASQGDGQPSLQALEEQYFALRTHKDAVLAACSTDAQKGEYLQAIAESRDNFYTALRNGLRDDDPQVMRAVADLRATQRSLTAALEHLATIAALLKAVATALAAGGSLVALATSA